jgi:hypothetical protein
MSLNTQAHEVITKNCASSRTQMKQATSGAAETAHTTNGFAVHRKHLRFPFVAQADVTTLRKGWHLVADVSQLSACGCYVDTPEPFNVGTEVRLCIRHAGSSCELHGRVIYAHKGWGMGVLFDDAAGQQFDVLDGWLAELEHKQGVNISPKFMVAKH